MSEKIETTEDALVKIKINQSFISYHLQDKNMRWTAIFVHDLIHQAILLNQSLV
ncbi:hypothetical protein [Mycoplasma sp. ATU-Cv-508]|uniref:hypothetical protein n=1 Tax=Mycoplasma sp. ATU-Cv-508 TaxID=2048001 RepID=UPI001374CCF0